MPILVNFGQFRLISATLGNFLSYFASNKKFQMNFAQSFSEFCQFMLHWSNSIHVTLTKFNFASVGQFNSFFWLRYKQYRFTSNFQVVLSKSYRKIHSDIRCCTTITWPIRMMWMWCEKVLKPRSLYRKHRRYNNLVPGFIQNLYRIANICHTWPTNTGNVSFVNTLWLSWVLEHSLQNPNIEK